MKHLAGLSAVVVAFAASAAWAQQGGMGGMGGMDMKDKKQGMDMSKCREMMDKGGMGMKGMEMPKECADMMEKPGKGKASAKGGEKKSQAKTHKGTGTVKNVDAAGGKVTIAHGPIASINWPAMNMTFSVKDKKMLQNLAPEKKVEFQFEQHGSDYVITSIK